MEKKPIILTAKMFHDHLRKNGDFRQFECYIVTELILLAHCEIFHNINLGNGTFKEPFLSIKSVFAKDFDCGNSIFEKELTFRKTGLDGNLIYKGEVVK